MNEEIRKQEIREKELETVSGGYEFSDIPMPGWEEGVTPVGAITEA